MIILFSLVIINNREREIEREDGDRQRDRKTERDRKRERGREREIGSVKVYPTFFKLT